MLKAARVQQGESENVSKIMLRSRLNQVFHKHLTSFANAQINQLLKAGILLSIRSAPILSKSFSND